MSGMRLSFSASSPTETCWLAAQIGRQLRSGDTLLLEGDIGAGKTHFARCLIQSRLPVHEDVPSPTFTLVQTYDTGDVQIWHADLYRLTHADEALELGLEDAFESAICLIEWPDRLGTDVPASALTLAFLPAETETARNIEAFWSDPRWSFLTRLDPHEPS